MEKVIVSIAIIRKENESEDIYPWVYCKKTLRSEVDLIIVNQLSEVISMGNSILGFDTMVIKDEG